MSYAEPNPRTLVGCVIAIACALVFLGCDTKPEERNPDLEIVACCGAQTGCTEIAFIDCLDSSGTPLEGVSSCSGDPCGKGACCNEGSCTTTTEADCEYRYQGDKTTCASGICSRGACCFDEAEAPISCEDSEAASCAEFGGKWQGLDTACEPTRPCGGTPTMGACCSTEGSCSVTDETNCVIADGSYAGNGVECTPGLCGSGACCDQLGGCTQTHQFSCFDEFQGSGTSCDTASCAPTEGACCSTDGSCADLANDEECAALDGDFQGGGSSCLGTICPNLLGACCLPSEACVELTKEECVAQTPPLTLSFQGEGFPCSEFLCQNPSGACCLPGGCQVTQEWWCLESSGVWLGGNVPCSAEEAAMCEP